MNIWENVKKTSAPNAHGEVNFFRIEEGSVDENLLSDFDPDENGFVVGHSESGHHHLLEREGVTMKKHTDSRGFQILHAIVTKPVALRQDTSDPHKTQIVEPGEYLITNNVEVDPFTKQARRVAD